MAGEKLGMMGVLLLLCAVAGLSACNRDSEPAPASAAAQVKPKAPAVVRRGPTPAEQTAGMVQAAAQGKSQLPIELKFDLGGRPKVGQALQIDLALISQISASPATIQVNAADGLSLAPGANTFEIASEEAGEVYRQAVTVTPNAEGILLIGVTVSLKHDETTDQRVFSIPIVAER